MGRKEKPIEPISKSFDEVLENIGDDNIMVSKENNFPKVLYKGVLPIGEMNIDCYVDNKNNRLLSSRAMQRLLKAEESGPSTGGKRLIRYTESPIITGLMKGKDRSMLKPFVIYDGKSKINAYKAESLPVFCSLVLKARRDGLLKESIHTRMLVIAEQCEIIQSSLSQVGIVALIDEATGFQYNRTHDALRILLEQYIQKESRKWLKEFPDIFFRELDRLYGNPKTTSKKRPLYYGTFINNYIYKPIENGEVLKELKIVNPNIDGGRRKSRHHQHLTEELGLRQLKMQMGKVWGLMQVSQNINQFKKNYSKTKGILTLFDD